MALKSQEKLKKRIMFICCSVSVPQLISRRRRVWRSSGGTFWTWLSRYRGNDELGTDGEENVTVTEFVLHQLLLLLWSQLFSHAPAVYSALPTLLLITACEFPRTVVSYLCYAGWTRFGHNVNFNLHMKQISASAFFFPIGAISANLSLTDESVCCCNFLLSSCKNGTLRGF